VGQAIASVRGVREVHDLHIWSITSGFPALAAHVTVSATCDANETRRAIEQMLESEYDLSHTTLQVVAEELLQLDN
jgi:cobalt-zinc-cadmium efflux system protein